MATAASASGVAAVHDGCDHAGLDVAGEELEVGGVHGGDEGAQGVVDEPGQHKGADLAVIAAQDATGGLAPTITSVPVGVRTLRRQDSDELPPMSRITSYGALDTAKSSRV
jgi:hypothetical protein